MGEKGDEEMKRVCVLALLLATVLLLPASALWSADLQAGWYSAIKQVDMYAYDAYGQPQPYTVGRFSTAPGTYGVLILTDEPFHYQYCRTARVASDVYGVPAGTLLELPFYNLSPISLIARLNVEWATDYDASQMRLELAQRNSATGAVTTLWTQNTSGVTGNVETLASDLQPDGLFFRVVAVPEPSGFLALVAPISALAVAYIRRRVPR
ncbi:MAG: hypothetical protein Q7T82_12445 [Armatimonadota bacterium]|nr:hypothetical protein [Armatimonadota bacterium]